MTKTIPLTGHIDSTNSDQWEKEILQAVGSGMPCTIVLDAEKLEYISSAGLRILLRLAQKYKDVQVINAQPAVYEIFDMTGFVEILKVQKALRKISIEGCKELGRGAHGTVYRIAPDTIVKVYSKGTAMETVDRERELSRKAFVKGVPTAIPYDIVLVGDQYGAVFELINAEMSSEYVNRGQKELDDFIEKSVALIKQIHSIQMKPGELPDMKEKTLSWAQGIKDYFSQEIYEKLIKAINDVPDSLSLLHADTHLKNFLICDGEPMFIDMDTICTGDPIFELATLYNSYKEFPDIDPNAAAFLGISVETASYIWEKSLRLYLDTEDQTILKETAQKTQLLGCVRIISYMSRQIDTFPPARHVIERCCQEITKLFYNMGE